MSDWTDNWDEDEHSCSPPISKLYLGPPSDPVKLAAAFKAIEIALNEKYRNAPDPWGWKKPKL